MPDRELQARSPSGGLASWWISGGTGPERETSGGHGSALGAGGAAVDAMVPQPGRRTLEVGCGEGRVARDLRRRGHQVIALDRSRTLVRYAQAADPDGRYLVADAAALPFPDALSISSWPTTRSWTSLTCRRSSPRRGGC